MHEPTSDPAGPCDEVSADDLATLLADVIGAIDLPDAPAARDSAHGFGEYERASRLRP